MLQRSRYSTLTRRKSNRIATVGQRIQVRKMSGRVVVKQRKKRGAKEPPLFSVEELLRAKEAAEQAAAAEDEEQADDGLSTVETYSEYWPSKLKIGSKHPDPVIVTASLASVDSVDITYQMKIPDKIIEKGLLSALQLEAVAYACQAHERFLSDKVSSRAGFLIGIIDTFMTVFRCSHFHQFYR